MDFKNDIIQPSRQKLLAVAADMSARWRDSAGQREELREKTQLLLKALLVLAKRYSHLALTWLALHAWLLQKVAQDIYAHREEHYARGREVLIQIKIFLIKQWLVAEPYVQRAIASGRQSLEKLKDELGQRNGQKGLSPGNVASGSGAQTGRISAAEGLDKRAYLIAGSALALVGLLVLGFSGEEEDYSSSRESSKKFTSAMLSSDQYIYYESEVRLPPRQVAPKYNGESGAMPPSMASPSDGIPDYAKDAEDSDGGGSGKDSPGEEGSYDSGKDGQNGESGKDGPIPEGDGYNDGGYNGDNYNEGGGYNDWNGGSVEGYDNF